MCCTSSLVRWNTKKSTKENWYFNQAYNGKVVNRDNIKDVLLQGLKCVSNKNFSIYKYDYRVTPIAAAVTDMVSLLQKMNTCFALMHPC